jgi:8-oxo-dGTP diphosphatase
MTLRNLAKAIGVEVVSTDSGLKASDAVMVTLDNICKQLEKVPYIPYPVAFHTVDIIATRNNSNCVEILLGQKGKEQDKTKWVFIGGFVDPTNTAESAALRELHEETNVKVTDEDRLIYIGSLFVDDGRFKDSPHKVTTSIFTLELTDEEAAQAVGGDDIQEVKWVALDDVLPLLKEHHIPLYHKFVTSKNKWVNLHHL